MNLLIKKDFKIAELRTKTSFSLYLRARPKNDKGNKGHIESISAKVIKRASKKMEKVEVNLNCSLWIGYDEKLIIDYFACIFLSTDNLAYSISIFSLVS